MDFSRITSFIVEHNYLGKVFISILWLFIVMVAINLINRLLYKTIEDNNKYYNAKKRVYYILSGFYFLVVVVLWANSSINLTTYIGLLSAGIAVALKDIFANIAGWLFIIIRRPLSVGDRIMINGSRGDVIDSRMFMFTLMEVSDIKDGEQSTGRIINVPNAFIFNYPLINYNKGFKYIWNEIKIVLTFESDWEKAKVLFTQVVNNHSLHLSEEAQKYVRQAAKKYMIHYSKLTPIVYTDVVNNGVQLTLRYLCTPKKRRVTVNNTWEDILIIIREHEDINLAYPTYRITDH